MKIASIEASVHCVEVTIPLIDEPIERRHVVFCKVMTDDGIAGYGLTGHFLPRSVAVALEKDFLDAVRGMDPRETEAIHHKLWWALNQRSMTGVFSSALSCLDIALWDIAGKAAGRTIAQLMGGARDAAPTYITFGFPEYDRDQLVEAALIQTRAGNQKLKLVVAQNKGGWQEDAVRVRLVRDAVGKDVDLMMDANYMFNPLDARNLANAVEDCRLSWFEEPLHQNDARALADLRSKIRIPLSAGQMEGHRWRLRELIDRQAVDLLQPNCAYNGGYTETRKVGHMAQAYNMQIANGGGWPILNMHTMAGLMNGWLVEFHLGMQLVGEMLFVSPPGPVNQMVKIPEKPGLGFEPNFDALRDTRVRD